VAGSGTTRDIEVMYYPMWLHCINHLSQTTNQNNITGLIIMHMLVGWFKTKVETIFIVVITSDNIAFS
jgi:uncharacterized hydantoinase/oxoprolinase family protein